MQAVKLSGMQPIMEEFLNLLLWSAEMLARPTFRNLTDSYEAWSYRSGMMRRVRSLEEQEMIERAQSASDSRLFRLTSKGRLHALGGRDPQAQWSRHWDGQWRLVLFDVPIAENSLRVRLRRYLQERCFGYLQNSVWITPDPLGREREDLAGGKIQVESLILMEARPCAGESDFDLVNGAWDFAKINRRYARHIKVLEERPRSALQSEETARAMLRWAAMEREAWIQAVTCDPLLPARILPSGYLGEQAWTRRVEVLREAARQLQAFKL